MWMTIAGAVIEECDMNDSGACVQPPLPERYKHAPRNHGPITLARSTAQQELTWQRTEITKYSLSTLFSEFLKLKQKSTCVSCDSVSCVLFFYYFETLSGNF